LLLFLEDLAAAFLVAISLTTFHAVRDLPVAPTWQKVLDRSSKLDFDLGETSETGMPTTFNSDLTVRAGDLVSGDHHFDCRKYAIDKSYCQAFVYRNRNEDELFHAVPHLRKAEIRSQKAEVARRIALFLRLPHLRKAEIRSQKAEVARRIALFLRLPLADQRLTIANQRSANAIDDQRTMSRDP
jgi:hypothetical protein